MSTARRAPPGAPPREDHDHDHDPQRERDREAARALAVHDELPRERALRFGVHALADAELLALLLGTGTAAEPVAQLAARLLETFGGRRGLARAGLGELSRAPGMGTARAARVLGALELARRALCEPLRRGAPYGTSRDVVRAYGPRLVDRADECVLAVLLDGRQRPVAERVLAQGGPTSCALGMREVFALAVREGGSALLLVHNHPSGDPTPSPDDEDFTRSLERAGRLLEVPLLDHVIVAREGSFSFLDAGLLPFDAPAAAVAPRGAGASSLRGARALCDDAPRGAP